MATYTLGRLCAVATRPLCLFVANNLLAPSAAQGLAVAFLASALALVGTAAGPERRFYAIHFNTAAPVNGLTFHLYASSVRLLAVLGGIGVAGLAFYFTDSLLLAAVAAVYFVSEKIADEILRLQLFERQFAAWGRLNIARSVAQVVGFGALLLILGKELTAPLVVLALVIGNLLLFRPPKSPVARRRSVGRRTAIGGWLGARAIRSLFRNRRLWIIALMSAAVSYLDRLVALVLDKAMLPLFMIVVMCFSVVQMAVDYYYVSRHRRDFLERTLTLRQALLSGLFLRSLAVGLALGAVVCAVVLRFSADGASFPIGYILVIATFQVCAAVTGVPREILYWIRPERILRVETAFWGLFAVLALAAWLLKLPALQVFAVVLVCVLLRLTSYLVAARVPAVEPSGEGRA